MKKRIIAIWILAALAVAGCGRQAGDPSKSDMLPEDEPALSQEEESGEADEDAQPARTESAGQTAPVVYMTTDISPEGLMAVYEALGWTPSGKVAVKLSTGEPPASNYLRPELIKDLVQTVEGGTRLTENYVGAAFADYDSYLVLSHFKGHAMAGFGGAIKNISIGLGSGEGKAWIHSGGTSRTSPWGGEQDAFLESMAEAGKSVSDYLDHGERIVYINVMNRLSVDCDCDGKPSEPDMHDIGILASADPVALEHAEQIGLGSRTYELVSIDD